MSLIQDLIARNRAGEAIGLPCFCTANEHVLRAVLDYAKTTGLPTVIEATCNQVNQYGGYTGMTAADFMEWLKGMARDAGVPMDQLILGGDHLGPNVWKNEPLDVAMEKSRELVKSYVQAGFKKIHLDTSMACGGEPNPTFAQIAERAADLCEVAEKYAPDPSELFYIIGTEVPIPGGETEEPAALDLTSVARFRDTIQTHRDAWDARGLADAWTRIVSYQSTAALADLVKNHFFFLKVGPELTFRFREAIWALASIEDAVVAGSKSQIRETFEARMTDDPGYWKDYYSGPEDELRILRTYSYSDRIRYYWSDPEIAKSLEHLLENLDQTALPETIVSQAFTGLEFGEMPTTAPELISRHVQRCVSRYFKAAGHKHSFSSRH